ncbi:RNA 2',3'-cyclic phosphodiesterase [Aestuariirhabdus sp. LZHN29]|uniref:RNA 2',3'-cyclic phosphodiesterase n=1 Tax=Aestuariirhabdus sp. LZHN29 TaxID=3417462 RepID=UPI003CE90BB3
MKEGQGLQTAQMDGLVRVFFSADLPVSASVAISAWVNKNLLTQFSRARWVPPENYHITLHFVGQVAGAAIDDLANTLQRLESTESITARCGGLIWLPDTQRPKVLALAVESSGALERLAECLNNPRPLRAHITLARRVASTDRGKLTQTAIPSFEFSLPSLSLRQSLSTADGVGYPSLSILPLGG